MSRQLPGIIFLFSQCHYAFCYFNSGLHTVIRDLDPPDPGIAIVTGTKEGVCLQSQFSTGFILVVNDQCVDPKFSKLAIPFFYNEPPRWPKVVAAVKNIIEVYAKNAKKHERVGEWIERIGWEKFFQLTGIEFTFQHIDDFTFARDTFRTSPTFKW